MAILRRWHELLQFKPKRQLRELYIFQLFFSFAFALITIFEPVFFYQQGFSLAHIAAYYALHYTLYIVIMPLGAQFAARFGLERSLAISLPLFIGYFLLLSLLPNIPNLFWVTWAVLTIHKIFYWPAYHATFAKFTAGANRGTELSWMNAITYGAGILGPLLGGVIAMRFGFPTLFICAAIFVFGAGIPLLRTRERFRLVELSYAAGWRLIASGQHRRMTAGMIGWGEDLIHLVFWPVWLFIVLGSTQMVGFVAALAIAITTVASFIIGDLIDRYSSRHILRYAAPLISLGYLVRIAASTPARAIGVDIYARVANVSMSLPFVAALYTAARRVGVLHYALAFETMLALAKALTAWGLVGLFLLVTPETGFTLTFYLAAILALFYAVL